MVMGDSGPCGHLESPWPTSFGVAGVSASTGGFVEDIQVYQKIIMAVATQPPKQGKAKCDLFLSALG